MSRGRFDYATANVGTSGPSQDRVAVRLVGGLALVVLADGAGGVGGGAEAAEAVIECWSSWQWREALDTHGSAARAWLASLDAVLASAPSGGQCTAVVAVVGNGRIAGASVGDSAAWLFTPEGMFDLTESQRRKPLLGAGRAAPVAFARDVQHGRLLVASDGLFAYASPATVASHGPSGDVVHAAAALVQLARLPSGRLQDDLSLALLDVAPRLPT